MLYQILSFLSKHFAARKFSNWSTKENQNYQISACLTGHGKKLKISRKVNIYDHVTVSGKQISEFDCFVQLNH